MTDLERKILDLLRNHPQGRSAREVRDELETDERGSATYSKSRVRRPLESLVRRGLVNRAVDYYPSSRRGSVTYHAGSTDDGG